MLSGTPRSRVGSDPQPLLTVRGPGTFQIQIPWHFSPKQPLDSLLCEVPLWNVGWEAQYTLQGPAPLSEPQILRVILTRLTFSPAHAPGMGQEQLQQGRKKLPALQLVPLGDAGTFPAPCPCRENPHSSGGVGRRSVHLHPGEGKGEPPAPIHLEEPPGMGSVVRAQGEGPSCQGDQLGTSAGW